MKQYLTVQQTDTLISLGLAKPTARHTISKGTNIEIFSNYSIGELLELLPPQINGWDFDIHRDWKWERWIASFNPETQFGVATELIDAIYNLILKLKEENIL